MRRQPHKFIYSPCLILSPAMYVGIFCPACKQLGLSVTFHEHELPYFGDVMESVAACSSCNYRHVDVILLAEKEPCRYTLSVESEEDMLIRVVRSSHAAIEIPELGVKITPGSEAQGFISNVEGILARVEDVLRIVLGWEEEDKRKKAVELLGELQKVRAGEKKVRIILNDPSGNSAILSDKAVKERMQ